MKKDFAEAKYLDMLDISKLSRTYDVRRLNDADLEEIYTLCRANTQYYQYCEAKPTREQVLNDLHITPPGKDLASKYYTGFYQDTELIAVMDLIDGYPDPDICFIGFFMMNKAYQSRQVGSGIIREAAAYLKSLGYKSVRLAIDKGNPQSTHFWKKNGFVVISEVDRNGWTILVSEKQL